MRLYTTGNPTYAECRRLCQVQNIEHSAKLLFAECLPKNSRQTDDTRRKKTLPSAGHVTLGKAKLCRVPKSGHSANPPLPSATRAALLPRPLPVTAVIVCRVPARGHSANTSLPSATHRALGKDDHMRLCDDRYRYSLPSARLRHSAKI